MARQAVYELLTIQNRPYNANDILSNLGKDHSKSAIQKALDDLTEDGKIMMKTYTKQKIYCIVQDNKKDPKELMRTEKELQRKVNELEAKLQSLRSQIKKGENELDSLKKCLTLEELLAQKKNINENIKALNRKLDKLMTSSSAHEDVVSKKRKFEIDLETYQREYKKRKRKCMDVIDCILENYPKSKETFFEEVGIDIVNVDK